MWFHKTMRQIRRHILVLGILIIAVVLVSVKAFAEAENPSVSVTPIHTVVEDEPVQILDIDGEQYLFLPSSADISGLELQSDNAMISSELSSQADENGMYKATVSVTENSSGVSSSFSLNIMKGENIGTVFFTSGDATEKGRAWIDENRDNRGSGKAKVINENGKVIYNGPINDIHLRGRTSARDPKKGYAIKLDKKAALAGDKAGKKWVLLAQYKDPLKLSDKLCKEIAAISDDAYAANETWVHLYYDGEYRGIYLLSEKNEIKSNRIDITDMEKTYELQDTDYGSEVRRKTAVNDFGNEYQYQDGLEGPEQMGGYLFELDDQYMDENNGFYFTANGKRRHAEIDSPEQGSKEAVKYISEYFQEFCDAVDDPAKIRQDGLNTKTGLYYYDYCDIDSLVNTYLLQTIASNTDAFWKSQFFYKDVDKKMVSGPIWDMDMTFGTGWSSQPDPKRDILTTQVISKGLIQIPSFQKLVRERYFEHYQKVLDSLLTTGEEVPTFMDSYNYIKDDLRMDEVLWPIKLKLGSDRLEDPSLGRWEEGTTFDDIAVYRVNWIKNHKEFLDSYFGSMDPGDAHMYANAGAEGAESHVRKCIWCEETITEPHTIQHIEAIPATYDSEGVKEHYKCVICGKLFADEDAAIELSTEDIVDARMERTDISSASIEAGSVTYTGAEASPQLVVSINGVPLTCDEDYIVHNDGSRDVGPAVLTIEGIGAYTGRAAAEFKIIPKGTAISKLTGSKKAMTVKWKKCSTRMSASRITGYKIQYSTDKSFRKNVKTVKVKGYKKTSKKIKRLKSGKHYYVRVKTYIIIKGKGYYSDWSGIKKVKIR